MEKRESSYTVGWNANRYSHYGESYRFLKELKIELPYDPAILLLGRYLKTIISKDTYNPMFTEALFTLAKTWKQAKCPSTEE